MVEVNGSEKTLKLITATMIVVKSFAVQTPGYIVKRKH
jgi:hypothetical protein